MKILPSKLFPNCAFSPDEDAGFYDVVPQGFTYPVSLYLGLDTVRNDEAIEKAAIFFDRLLELDTSCRELFLTAKEELQDTTVIDYFEFYVEEVPEAFEASDARNLSLREMIDKLQFSGMASHNAGEEQIFVADFTLGYDQILCIYFGSDYEFQNISWDS